MTDEDRKSDLLPEEVEMLFTHVVAKVYGLRDSKDYVASAVAINIGDRRFLATAAHFLSGGAEIQVVRKPGGRPISSFLKRVWTDDGSDVGLLEIRPDDADSLEGHVAEGGIYAGLGVDEEQHVIVCGFPKNDIRAISKNQLVSFPRALYAATVPLADWPQNLEKPALEDRDLFIDYPEQARGKVMRTDKPVDGEPATEQPTVWPGGLSGGGVWLSAVYESPCSGVRAASPRLIGIQVAFVPGTRMLRATSIRKWLDLVEVHYPDLKDNVEGIRQQQL